MLGMKVSLFDNCAGLALSFASVLLLAGCGDTDEGSSSDAVESTPTLVRVDEEPAGDNCAEGGQAIATGPDENGNGTLEDSEVEETNYVCNGADGEDGETGDDGADALVRLEEEPAGDNCAEGGWKVLVGKDTDGDGTLSDEEVSETRYVCNGQDGASVVTRTEEVPPGDRCQKGGEVVEWGVDANQNGELDDDEVEASQVECRDSCPGDQVWNAVDEMCRQGTRLVVEGEVDRTNLDNGLLPPSVSEGMNCKAYAVYDPNTSPSSTDTDRADYEFSSESALWIEVGDSLVFESEAGETLVANVFDDINNSSYDQFTINSFSNADTQNYAIDQLRIGLSDENADAFSSTDIPSPLPALSEFTGTTMSVEASDDSGGMPKSDTISCSIQRLDEQP
jgi:hypothetical protein